MHLATPRKLAELMKMLRGRWLSCDELRIGLGWDWITVRSWTFELEQQGMLVRRVASSRGGRLEFTVSRAWGGRG